MSKLKTVGIVLLVPLLIAGALWGYLWYSTKQQVDQWVALAKPFADISYGGIDVAPTGSIGVNRLRIILHDLDDYLTIGSVRLKAPDILQLLKLRWQLSQGQLPPAMTFALHQFEIPLDGGLLGTSQETLSRRSPFGDLDALGCGPVTALGRAEWQEMGYHHLIGDMEAGYRLDSGRNVMELQLRSSSRDWATVDVDLGLAAAGAARTLAALATSGPVKLSKLHVVVRDEGFNQRRNQYCAAKAGKTIDAYLADHVRLLEDRLRANGVYPGLGLIEAYRQYLKEGGKLTLAAAPPAPIDPRELQFYKPGDAIKLAGLTLSVNDQPVSDLSVNWDGTKIARALAVGAESAPEAEEPRPSSPNAPPAMVQKSFRPVATHQLGQHIGQIARIKTANNSQYRGKLNAVAEGSVSITISRSGGSVTLSLRQEDITDAQILQ
ncbi:MAG: hypothetical protein JNM60_07760 [Candidatus Competibacteraceae bacterium]|nr:hypothetical protein [Candidatus Competibacteraceae bacterium]